MVLIGPIYSSSFVFTEWEWENTQFYDLCEDQAPQSKTMLASLDGLMQLHCNGNVTKAHDRLEKHLNQQAHGQYRNGNS